MLAPGSRVLVWGLGKTGFESAKFLVSKGFQVIAWDSGKSQWLSDVSQQLKHLGVSVHLSESVPEVIFKQDWVLISPGISPFHKTYQQLKAALIPIFSEIEVASWYSQSPHVIAVTGSVGKTTVSTVLGNLLKRMGRQVLLCGNVGNPWIGEMDHISQETFVVVEVSSFQLAHCKSFRPQIAVLLNVSPNHLDWHGSMEAYANAKVKIFENQQSCDYAVLPKDVSRQYCSKQRMKANVIFMDTVANENPNEQAVFCVANILKCPQNIIQENWEDFKGLPHRLEEVGEREGVRFVNDSKSTSTASLAWALKKFSTQSVLLIAGGIAKSEDFDSLKPFIKKNVKGIFLIGQSQGLLASAWKAVAPVHQVDDLEVAMKKAVAVAQPGDVVLLSPACASFDQFKNYEERGNIFRRLVQRMSASTKEAIQ